MNLPDPFYILVLIFFILFTYKIFSKIFGLFYIPSQHKSNLHSFYSRYSNYFNNLSPKLQKRFVYRSYSISGSIKVVGRQGFEVNQHTILLVVAAIVQITFGFRYYNLPRFRTILVYPDSYISPITGKLHDGEVNPRGVIVLSWKKLVKGFADPYDNINLGLHEMAHALMHTIIYTKKHELNLDQFLEKVLKLSEEEISKIKSDEFHLFRSYASTNIAEFFAVSIEHFFEGPTELKKSLPRLYQKLTLLLKQDPANKIFLLP